MNNFLFWAHKNFFCELPITKWYIVTEYVGPLCASCIKIKLDSRKRTSTKLKIFLQLKKLWKKTDTFVFYHRKFRLFLTRWQLCLILCKMWFFCFSCEYLKSKMELFSCVRSIVFSFHNMLISNISIVRVYSFCCCQLSKRYIFPIGENFSLLNQHGENRSVLCAVIALMFVLLPSSYTDCLLAFPNACINLFGSQRGFTNQMDICRADGWRRLPNSSPLIKKPVHTNRLG